MYYKLFKIKVHVYFVCLLYAYTSLIKKSKPIKSLNLLLITIHKSITKHV